MQEFVLVAEDDVADHEILQRAFQKMAKPVRFHVVFNGEQVIEYLTGQGQFADREEYPFPSVLLLDMKMPRCGGQDVLRWMQKNPQCAVIPTIMWTASTLANDVETAYKHGATSYLVKPGSIEGIREILETTLQYWRLNKARPVP